MNNDRDRIIDEVRPVFGAITRFTETADADSTLRYYANIPDFLAVSADGLIRHYADFEKICIKYYDSIWEQKLTTNHELYHVLDNITVVLCWSGNIEAFFKNGDIMKLPNYTVTFLFQKTRGGWKVIHCHESALPPQIIPESALPPPIIPGS